MPRINRKDRVSVLSPEQSRAARGWLGWSQAELANRASVALRTVQGFENGEKVPIPNNVAALRRAIEEAGIWLVFDKAGAAAGILRHGADADLPTGAPRPP